MQALNPAVSAFKDADLVSQHATLIKPQQSRRVDVRTGDGREPVHTRCHCVSPGDRSVWPPSTDHERAKPAQIVSSHDQGLEPTAAACGRAPSRGGRVRWPPIAAAPRGPAPPHRARIDIAISLKTKTCRRRAGRRDTPSKDRYTPSKDRDTPHRDASSAQMRQQRGDAQAGNGKGSGSWVCTGPDLAENGIDRKRLRA